MKYYQLEPEVAGGWGVNTVADTSIHPPVVTRLHYEFSGWLGDCIVESFPCFIVTESTANAIQVGRLTGCEVADCEISLSDEFSELNPNGKLPFWRWLKTIGIPGKDDFASTNNSLLVVSERALDIFREHGLEYCNVTEYKG